MPTSDQGSRLTVAVIVRDAAEALDETLASIQGIADQIVVVDTGSKDGTIETARRRGALVLERPWDHDFSAARNCAPPLAQGQWLLWLDAGETMSADAAKGLREFLDERADSSKAYMLMVQAPPSGGQAAPEQIGRVRLMPNTDVIQFRGRVREDVTQALVRSQIEVEGLPYRILRGPCENDPQVKTLKARRNLRLAEAEIQVCGTSPRLLNCMGDALQTLGDYARSEQCFRCALEESEEGSSEMLEAYYGLLTSLDGKDASGETQLSVCLEALELYPLDAQLLCAMGGYLRGQGRTDLAARAYLTAYQYGTVNPEVWHLEGIAEVAAACHSLTLQLQHKDEEARQFLQEALGADGNSPRLRRQLLELHVKHGRRDEALAQLETIAERTPNAAALRNAIRGACLVRQEKWVSARAYLEAAYQAGCRDPICLRWLTVALASTGQSAQARDILEEWKQLDPHSVEPECCFTGEGGGRPGGGSPQHRIDEACPPAAGPVPGPVASPSAAHGLASPPRA